MSLKTYTVCAKFGRALGELAMVQGRRAGTDWSQGNPALNPETLGYIETMQTR